MLKAFLIKALLSLNKIFRFLGCTEEGKVGYLEGGVLETPMKFWIFRIFLVSQLSTWFTHFGCCHEKTQGTLKEVMIRNDWSQT